MKIFYLLSKIKNEAFLLLIFILIGCSEPQSYLELSFIKDPVGGVVVQTVSAELQGSISYDRNGIFNPSSPDPIEVNIEWWWDNLELTRHERVKAEIWSVSSEITHYYSTYFTLGPDLMLLNYFSVKASWNDDKGEHNIQSSKVLCLPSQ